MITLNDVSLTSYEQAVKQIRSVLAARIKVNSNGEIEEVHTLAGPGRNPKQIVRDIESVLAAQFGVDIDHKKISVAQLEEEDTPFEETPFEDSKILRPKLIGVSFRTIKTKAEARVELLAGEESLVALVDGPASTYNKQRLLVDATLAALGPLILEGCVFVTEDVVITQLGRHQAALVTITLITSSGEHCLMGCALVKRDDSEAVVKAALDAVNRKLKFLHFQK